MLSVRCLIVLLVLNVAALSAANIPGQDSSDVMARTSLRVALEKIDNLRQADSILPAIHLVDSLLQTGQKRSQLSVLKGELLLMSGDTNSAETVLKNELDIAPMSSSARLLLAQIDLKEQRYESVRKSIDFMMSLGRKSHHVLFLLGEYYDSKGFPDSAAASYRKAVEVLLKKRKMVP